MFPYLLKVISTSVRIIMTITGNFRDAHSHENPRTSDWDRGQGSNVIEDTHLTIRIRLINISHNVTILKKKKMVFTR